MNASEFIWMDGKLVKWDDAKVHVLTHSLHYGMPYLKAQELIKQKRV